MSDVDPSDLTVRRSDRHRAALRRWSIAAIALASTGVVGSEVAGGVWPMTLVTPMARQLAVALTLGAVGLRIASRRERVWIAVAILVGVYAWLVALGAVPWRDVPTAQRVVASDAKLGTLKILSANVHSSNLDHASLLALIDREQPDVVLLMELTSPWIDALAPLKTSYAVRQVVADDAGNFGIGVWSRLPADDARLVVRQHRAEPSLDDVAHAELTLLLNGHRVRFVGVHPLPPLVPRMSAARDDLLRAITDEVAADDAPTIVAGDLNATRYCRITRDLCSRAGLRDAMLGVRFSWPTTMAGTVLGIRIDQVLCDDAWRVVESHAGPTVGSDHLPMVATLQLTRATR